LKAFKSVARFRDPGLILQLVRSVFDAFNRFEEVMLLVDKLKKSVMGVES
jgi:hypothetical protein